MPDNVPQILTSNSALQACQKCNRMRWWAYEALSDPATGARGWERQRLSLPLSTGGWCHRVAQGLFLVASGGDLTGLWHEAVLEAYPSLTEPLNGLETPVGAISTSEWIAHCTLGYKDEARRRGLDLGLQMDGQAPEERFVERTIAEQAALLEAFGWAFQRVRLPRLMEEYELVDVEREEFTLLSGDVGLQSRCDAVLRRRNDQRLFIYNLKTSGNPDKRWKDSFEVDAQLMTETLAVERRLSERVYGVIIDGFDKGVRVEVDFQTLKERPKDGVEKWQAQRSRLIYGYKCEETIPERPTLYDYEGTTRKGWEKFAVWEENFFVPRGSNHVLADRPVAYWVNWLPQEQVEAAFITLPPIMRSDRAVDSAVRQMVETEASIRRKRDTVELHDKVTLDVALDWAFPQSFRSCVYPSRCSFYALCHEGGAEDPGAYGYQPRTPNHPSMNGEE